MKKVIAYKLAQVDGWDFYTGRTINYRENIGKIVRCPNPNPTLGICSNGVIHASKNPNDCFIGASIPCSAYKVEGKPVCGDKTKWGFIELKVLEEVINLDQLFGWKYNEAIKPINPLRRKVKPTQKDIKLLKVWDSVWDGVWASVRDSVWASVGDSVGDSVGNSVWASVGDSVWDSVGDSVGNSVWDSMWDSVRASVRNSVGDSVRAYIGSLFPNIKSWKYIHHKKGQYPFQSVIDLWERGLTPSFDGKTWRLHSGRKAEIVFQITEKELKEGK